MLEGRDTTPEETASGHARVYRLRSVGEIASDQGLEPGIEIVIVKVSVEESKEDDVDSTEPS